jgi:mRNA interferase MazF
MTAPPPGWYPRRGEVYMAPVDKRRPVIIISRDELNAYSFDVCVIPLTRVRRMAFAFRPSIAAGEGGLQTESWAKCDQLATIPKTALHYPPRGFVSARELENVAQGIKLALKLA